ncbi:MAG: transcriptional repressor [Bacteroidia bacterium]|nr:transcriptional repressor [Bacteroidia bacterium]
MRSPSPAAERLLRDAKLRVTPARLQVLQVFLDRQVALPHSELEALVAGCDRVTLYRTLGTFAEAGLVHRVPDDAGATKYALCPEGCTEQHHHDDHIHFKCTVCGETQCLDARVPAYTLPQGFRPTEVSFLVQGRCPKCPA